MTAPETEVRLSSAVIDPASGLGRESPRPHDLRNDRYDADFDRDTLFYDCYRVGPRVVLQGPPFFNLLRPLLASAPLAGEMRRWFGRPRLVTRDKRGEVWLRSGADRLTLAGPIGTYDLAIGADLSHLFAGRRVILTLSKDNAPRWIHDWVRFYRAEHQADAALIYDNGSSAYTAAELQAGLRAAFPDMVIHVVDWPFRYGAQGGLAGAVDGREAPWDSDFCQTGSFQHARLRLLRQAKSVLNVDIDELVLSATGGSIFAATERSRAGFIKFAGHWISSASPGPVTPETSRHADFTHRDRREDRTCPPKWCLVPARDDPFRITWSVHNLFGSRHNRRIDPAFSYRHMSAISTGWKEDRTITGGVHPEHHVADSALADSFVRAGLTNAAVALAR
jgi:hypothetical protein